MQYTRIAIIGLSCLMLACATPYPNTPEGQVAFYVNQAQVAISKGNCSSAGPEIDAAISRPTGNEKIKEFFSKDEKARDCYYELHQKQNWPQSGDLLAN